MKMRALFAMAFMLLAGALNLQAQKEKKVLTHEENSSWKYLKYVSTSDKGNYVSYEVNPLEGDGYLYLYGVKSEKLDSIYRANSAKFSADETFMAFKINPQRDSLLAKRRAEVEKDQLPKDSLGIWNLKTNKIEKIARVKSFKLPKDKGDWLAVQLEKALAVKDTAEVVVDTIAEVKKEETPKEEKKEEKQELKSKKGLLLALNPIQHDSLRFKHIAEYSFSENGKLLGMLMQAKDSLEQTALIVLNTETRKVDTLFKKQGESKGLSIGPDGNQLAFMFSADTTKNKVYQLHYLNLTKPKLSQTLNTTTKGMPNAYTVSAFEKIRFSKSGERMYLGTAPIPIEETKDTLLAEEKVSVDIWHWKDPEVQPAQLLSVEKEKKRTFDAVFFTQAGKFVQLGSTDVPNIDFTTKFDDNLVLGINSNPYKLESQWSGRWNSDIYLVHVKTGKAQLLLKEIGSEYSLSPDQKFIAWFDLDTQHWYSKETKSGKVHDLTAGLTDVNFYDEDQDLPVAADPYGYMGWLKDDKGFVVYDRYDLWILDPKGNRAAINGTNSFGRSNKIQLRYNTLDRDEQFVNPEGALLAAFNESTKGESFYSLKQGQLKELIGGDYRFSSAKKPKKGDVLVYSRQNYQEYPNIWVADRTFKSSKKISNANPQQSEYNWGKVELVEWKSFGNKDLQGLLYKPENFDPNKKYPMLVYFYETYSDNLHRHYVPKPTYSTINFTYYASNGYLIFVPDIKYGVGNPGRDAYDAIISGTEALCNKYDYVDRDHLGIQGQSWGGYQTAFLVTQTDMFAAAEAGAPVSNMTSAYGGIRWGSGMSRQFQYEQTQSRIGGTLWEKPMNYYNNSPIFFADQVKTPLMIMHNDEDGAVPWYQGIEYFMALRRLQKPVWLVNYNGAPHNLDRLADRKDLTIRLQQFFDHFLKAAPAPEWLKNGLPAVKKGKTFGFETAK